MEIKGNCKLDLIRRGLKYINVDTCVMQAKVTIQHGNHQLLLELIYFKRDRNRDNEKEMKGD